jgi:hypothetical protein
MIYINDRVKFTYQDKEFTGILVGKMKNFFVVAIRPEQFGENVPEHNGVQVLLYIKEEEILKI